MAPMKKLRQERVAAATGLYDHPLDSAKYRAFAAVAMIFGPLFLMYLNVRCGKNQCVLFQLPLVLPTHLGAYFSLFSFCTVMSFISLMFLFTLSSRAKGRKPMNPLDGSSISPGLSSLMSTSMLLISLAYLKPDYIKIAYSEYLRLLATTILFCFVFSLIIFALVLMKTIPKERDVSRLSGFFYGYTTRVKMAQIDLKYFFFVHVGMVAWALLDLLIFINYVLDRVFTAPLAFLCVTQLIVIVHTLLYEKFLSDRPFMHIEGFGFFWLMRVMMFMPFFFSLPVMYAASTEISIPKPAMLADCVLFLLGFVIYVSSIHQKENFVANPLAYRSFSGLSIIVLSLVYICIFLWLHQVSEFNKARFSAAWNRYTSVVPYRVIPLIY